MSKTILVTGGAGFIGSHVVKKLLAENYKVICVDNMNSYYNERIKEYNIEQLSKNSSFVFYRTDITDIKRLEKIFNKEKIKSVCHIAARAGVRASIENPHLYEQTNVAGTLNLLEVCRQYGVKSFIFASSSSVYGNSKKIPFSESDNTDFPISPYAATKKSIELLAYTYHHLYGIHCTGLRFFTVYGPSGRPDMAPFLFVDAVYRGLPIRKYGDGKTKRDYTYIDDIALGVVKAIEKNLPFEIVNLGNNTPVDLNTFIRTIEEVVGKKAVIEKCPMQPGDVDITYADISKAKKLLGFKPTTSLKEGMEKFFTWYKDIYLKDILHEEA